MGSDAAWQAMGAAIVAAITALLAPSVMRRFQVEDKREDGLVKELEGYRTERAQELIGLRNECTELRVKNTSLSTQIDELRRSVETLTAKVTELTSDNQRMSREVERLTSENVGLYRQLNELRSGGSD